MRIKGVSHEEAAPTVQRIYQMKVHDHHHERHQRLGPGAGGASKDPVCGMEIDLAHSAGNELIEELDNLLTAWKVDSSFEFKFQRS
jgi:hypothetical protein